MADSHQSNRHCPMFMLIQHNYLRFYRKPTSLSQVDMAALSNMPSRASVARCEKGIGKMAIELLLLYHILFGVPVETMFERQKHEVLSTIQERISERIAKLKFLKSQPKTDRRISYLE